MARNLFRNNSRLSNFLGRPGLEFAEHAVTAIERVIPHVKALRWSKGPWSNPGAVWAGIDRTGIRVTLAVGARENPESCTLTTQIERRQVSAGNNDSGNTLDKREYDICKRIVLRASEVVRGGVASANPASIKAISDAFDEYVVAQHLEEHHKLKMPISLVFDALRTLSEQSYENKSLTFGCLLDPNRPGGQLNARFPKDFLASKKYKALSDGFRTSYYVCTNGQIHDFVDLENFSKTPLTGKHHYPDWAEPMARASRKGKCGVALSRQGDILVFDEGSLRFTYRFGRWQYWNHAYLINLLRRKARVQKVPRNILGDVVGAIYRAALDVSFRRSGGLFVILRRQTDLPKIVRRGDAISDGKRTQADREFDEVLRNKKIQSLARSVIVELASLDGAVVLSNSGKILAYGAVLQPKKAGRLRGTEGSRTKAAIGASNYGLVTKISADGDIAIYHEGKEFIHV